MLTQKIVATAALAALPGVMVPAAHAQARPAARIPVQHAMVAAGPVHPYSPGGGPGPSHAVYGRPGYAYGYGYRYGRYYYPYRPYYRYSYYPYYGGPRFFAYGPGYYYPYYYAGFYPYYGYVGYPYYYPYPYAAPGGYAAVPSYGGIRIDLPQKDAQVYVDGYFAGRVIDFDGSTGRLDLSGGPHSIEISAAGFAPLTVGVNIQRGRTITYRADLRQRSQPSPQ